LGEQKRINGTGKTKVKTGARGHSREHREVQIVADPARRRNDTNSQAAVHQADHTQRTPRLPSSPLPLRVNYAEEAKATGCALTCLRFSRRLRVSAVNISHD